MDNNPEKRKRRDHTLIVDRNKLNKKNHTVFNENETRILNSFKINPFASPSAGAPALKYGDVNTVTPSPGEVKGLIIN